MPAPIKQYRTGERLQTSTINYLLRAAGVASSDGATGFGVNAVLQPNENRQVIIDLSATNITDVPEHSVLYSNITGGHYVWSKTSSDNAQAYYTLNNEVHSDVIVPIANYAALAASASDAGNTQQRQEALADLQQLFIELADPATPPATKTSRTIAAEPMVPGQKYVVRASSGLQANAVCYWDGSKLSVATDEKQGDFILVQYVESPRQSGGGLESIPSEFFSFIQGTSEGAETADSTISKVSNAVSGSDGIFAEVIYHPVTSGGGTTVTPSGIGVVMHPIFGLPVGNGLVCVPRPNGCTDYKDPHHDKSQDWSDRAKLGHNIITNDDKIIPKPTHNEDGEIETGGVSLSWLLSKCMGTVKPLDEDSNDAKYLPAYYSSEDEIPFKPVYTMWSRVDEWDDDGETPPTTPTIPSDYSSAGVEPPDWWSDGYKDNAVVSRRCDVIPLTFESSTTPGIIDIKTQIGVSDDEQKTAIYHHKRIAAALLQFTGSYRPVKTPVKLYADPFANVPSVPLYVRSIRVKEYAGDKGTSPGIFPFIEKTEDIADPETGTEISKPIKTTCGWCEYTYDTPGPDPEIVSIPTPVLTASGYRFAFTGYAENDDDEITANFALEVEGVTGTVAIGCMSPSDYLADYGTWSFKGQTAIGWKFEFTPVSNSYNPYASFPFDVPLVPQYRAAVTTQKSMAQRAYLPAICYTLDQNEVLIPGMTLDYEPATVQLNCLVHKDYDHSGITSTEGDENYVNHLIPFHYVTVIPPETYSNDMEGTPDTNIVKLVMRSPDPVEEVESCLITEDDFWLTDWDYVDEFPTCSVAGEYYYAAVTLDDRCQPSIREPYGAFNDCSNEGNISVFMRTTPFGMKYICCVRLDYIPFGYAVSTKTPSCYYKISADENCAPRLKGAVYDISRTGDKLYLKGACYIPKAALTQL